MSSTQDTSMTENVRSQVEPQLQNIQAHLPDRRQVQGALSWLVAGLAPFVLGMGVLIVGGITFTGGVVVLAIATPIFVLLSPILVPLGAIVVLLFVVGTISLAAVSAVVWLYRYVKGEEPVYSDRVDAARNRIAGTAQEVKGWAVDHVSNIQAASSA